MNAQRWTGVSRLHAWLGMDRLKPSALPNVKAVELAAWNEGWWAGLMVGIALGVAIGVVLALQR